MVHIDVHDDLDEAEPERDSPRAAVLENLDDLWELEDQRPSHDAAAAVGIGVTQMSRAGLGENTRTRVLC